MIRKFLSNFKRNVKLLRKKPAEIRTEGILRTAAKISARESFSTLGRLDYTGHEIFMTADSAMQIYRLNACRKEPATVHWIESNKGLDVFYDIGANVGAYSFVALKNGFKKIYSFEPSFSTFSALCENIHLNKCADKIIPFCLSLGDHTKLTEFSYRSLVPGEVLHKFENGGLTQQIISFRLDDFIERFNLPPPNCVKIDVDGYELEVLRGMEKTLNCIDLRSMQVEIDESNREKVFDILRKSGFILQSDDSKFGKSFVNYIFNRVNS